MKNTLIVLVHPNYKKESKLNKALINEVKDLENITIHNLYEQYPDFKIDVKKEQEILLQYDAIVFQFPFYWYSSPALLKEWIDLVLTTDFAYEDTHMLKGKKFLITTTTGASEKTYKDGGTTVEDFLVLYKALSEDILVEYQKPFIVHSSFVITDEELKITTKNYKEYLEKL